ncbi:hypothetical protein [Ferviditalea candida]|uniref:DUF4190 domain-containing protein n=1 Tax=Ferviditalea candida TaxID=3108399 RepID=A0ABU5ZDT3_9BACL|nr:hypothetical protein [Paenibacillaceae bacterium T2]
MEESRNAESAGEPKSASNPELEAEAAANKEYMYARMEEENLAEIADYGGLNAFGADARSTEGESGLGGAAEENDTEFAAEATPLGPEAHRLIEPEDDRPDQNRAANTGARQATPWVGWLALALAIASLFMWPAVLGPAGAVLGLMAYFQGSRSLGIWSMVIGIIAFVAYVAIVPYYT